MFKSVLVLFSLIFILEACGVKGPPLPPMATTPAKSDRNQGKRATPSPSPSPKR